MYIVIPIISFTLRIESLMVGRIKVDVRKVKVVYGRCTYFFYDRRFCIETDVGIYSFADGIFTDTVRLMIPASHFKSFLHLNSIETNIKMIDSLTYFTT